MIARKKGTSSVRKDRERERALKVLREAFAVNELNAQTRKVLWEFWRKYSSKEPKIEYQPQERHSSGDVTWGCVVSVNNGQRTSGYCHLVFKFKVTSRKRKLASVEFCADEQDYIDLRAAQVFVRNINLMQVAAREVMTWLQAEGFKVRSRLA